MSSTFQQAAEQYGTPLYVYHADTIRQQAQIFKAQIGLYPKTEFLYAIKANFNPHILKVILDQGFGVDAVSIEEIKLALHVGCDPANIMYTENYMSDSEMHEAHELGILLNVNSLYRLDQYGTHYPGSRVCVRFNPNVGAASHATNITGGPGSKFGISTEQTDAVLELIKKHQLKLVGIHQHIGSGWLETKEPMMAMDFIVDMAKALHDSSAADDLEFIDFGGGFGVPYGLKEPKLNLEELGSYFDQKMRDLNAAFDRELILKFEPGRFLVADSGVLLTRATTIKSEPDGRQYLGLDTSMNHLARVALYGSYHPVEILTKNRDLELYDVCGNICECADFFAKDRLMHRGKTGDLVLIHKAGAYGMAMANNYQFRPRPAEIMYDNGEFHLIRHREKFEDALKIFPELKA